MARELFALVTMALALILTATRPTPAPAPYDDGPEVADTFDDERPVAHVDALGGF